jgi:hypothetical protein
LRREKHKARFGAQRRADHACLRRRDRTGYGRQFLLVHDHQRQADAMVQPRRMQLLVVDQRDERPNRDPTPSKRRRSQISSARAAQRGAKWK